MGRDNRRIVSGAPDRELEDKFERTANDGTVIRFERKPNIPNPNFFNIYIGSKNYGYFAKQMTGAHWTIVFNLVDDIRYEKTGELAVLNIVETLGYIMS